MAPRTKTLTVPVPDDQDLWERREAIDRLLVRMHRMLIEEPIANPTIPHKEARAVLEGDQQWAKLLLALAVLWHHRKMNEPRSNTYTKEVYKGIAKIARQWANRAKLPWPQHDERAAAPDPVRPRTLGIPPRPEAGCHG